MPELFFVFDVESVGLHGIGFAYGFVVVDRDGVEQESGYAALMPDLSGVDAETGAFLKMNVLPALWGFTHQIPTVFAEGDNSYLTASRVWKEFRDIFWQKWLEWKEKGAVLVSDCAWPVEARFLAACVDDDRANREWQGPYPLIDVSSVLLANGKSPVGTFERKAGESPAHNPLCDARQSARIFIETLNDLKAQKEE